MYACITRETFVFTGVFTVFQRVFHSILELKLCWHTCRRWDQIISTCRHRKNMPTTSLPEPYDTCKAGLKNCIRLDISALYLTLPPNLWDRKVNDQYIVQWTHCTIQDCSRNRICGILKTAQKNWIFPNFVQKLSYFGRISTKLCKQI